MNRRKFLQTAGAVGAGLVAGSALGSQHADASAAVPGTNAATKPNIVVILVDQLRTPQGAFDQNLLDQAAPNLAALRKKSVTFDHNYAAATACSPSRSCIVTGLYTHQNGMFLTNVQGLNGAPPSPDLNSGFPTWGSILSTPEFGYKTYWYGKWHLDSADQGKNIDGQPIPCDYSQYGFSGALPCPSPDGAPGQGEALDPSTAYVFKQFLSSYNDTAPFCTTVSLLNPHDVEWYPKWTATVNGQNNPPVIPQFHTSLPANFEKWPEALFNQNKPTTQYGWAAVCDAFFGEVPYVGPNFEEAWYELLDLYYLVTSYVDIQLGNVLDALKNSKFADNTIVVFTSDHGEYGGAHGLRGKAFTVYEESTRVPLYVYDPTGKYIPAAQQGTVRTGLTSLVDVVPLLMTLASGSNDWRSNPQYAHLAKRHDVAAMLSNPAAPGRSFIVHSSDESFPEEAPRVNVPAQSVLIGKFLPPAPKPQLPPPNHVVGYRTEDAKLGAYSYWKTATIEIDPQNQQFEMYDYTSDGVAEVKNRAPGGPAPEPAKFNDLLDKLFNPSTGAYYTELRAPLPAYLQSIQQQAYTAYLGYLGALTPVGKQYVPYVATGAES